MSVCRSCRQVGSKLFLKGDRCNLKCPIDKKKGKPGNLKRSSNVTEYGKALREKQALKQRYFVSEKQFASKIHTGILKKDIFQDLERLLVNVVYKAGWAVSMKQARQFISHKFIFVESGESKKLGHQSMMVNVNDVVFIKKNKIDILKSQNDDFENINVTWLEKIEVGKVKVVKLPTESDIDCSINKNMVINFYSR